MEIPPELGQAMEAMRGHRLNLADAKATYLEIPPDIRTALIKKFELKAVDWVKTHFLDYPLEQREIDHRRVLPLRAAIGVLQELEEALVQSQVRDPAQLLWRRWRVTVEALELAWNHWKEAWDIFREAILPFIQSIDIEDPLNFDAAQFKHAAEIGYAGIIALFGIIASSFSAEAFSKVAISVFTEREKAIAKARKKVFPQSTGPRFRRRKRAR